MKLDKCSSSSCELLEADPTFAAYSVMSLSPGGGHLVMGNLSGIVKLLTLPYHGTLSEKLVTIVVLTNFNVISNFKIPNLFWYVLVIEEIPLANCL